MSNEYQKSNCCNAPIYIANGQRCCIACNKLCEPMKTYTEEEVQEIIEKKCACPTCGHALNARRITIIKTMVLSLRSVYTWCIENNRHEFKRSEVSHLFKVEAETTHFGDWIHFGGLLYKREQGEWGMNMERTKEFLEGRLAINTVCVIQPINKATRLSDPRIVTHIKGISDFLDSDGRFIPEYVPRNTI